MTGLTIFSSLIGFVEFTQIKSLNKDPSPVFIFVCFPKLYYKSLYFTIIFIFEWSHYQAFFPDLTQLMNHGTNSVFLLEEWGGGFDSRVFYKDISFLENGAIFRFLVQIL